jgi:hypothetical protein
MVDLPARKTQQTETWAHMAETGFETLFHFKASHCLHPVPLLLLKDTSVLKYARNILGDFNAGIEQHLKILQ